MYHSTRLKIRAFEKRQLPFTMDGRETIDGGVLPLALGWITGLRNLVKNEFARVHIIIKRVLPVLFFRKPHMNKNLVN